MQVGQGQAQGGVNRFIEFARQSLVEELQLRRLGAFLQVLRCRQPDSAIGGEQLMAGQRGVDQTPQAVVQAQDLGLAIDHQLPLLQGVDQLDTCRIGLRGPGFQQPGLLCGIGRGEILSVASLYRQRQQQQASEDQAVKRGGHISGLARTLWERACSRMLCVSHIVAGCAADFASKLAPTGVVSGPGVVFRPDIQWLSCS
ncbi:hypothetical protein D3C84_746060 [compost metagenome]